MRILVLGQLLKDPGLGLRSWLVDGHAAVGHTVIDLDTYALAAVHGLHGMTRIVHQYADVWRPQVILLLTPTTLEAATVTALKRQGALLVSLRIEDGRWLQPGKPPPPREVALRFGHLDAHCDWAVTTSRAAASWFAASGVPSMRFGHLPYGWQAVPAFDGPKRPVITFIGAPDHPSGGPAWRVPALRALLAAGQPVEAHGDDWNRIPDLRAIARPTPAWSDTLTLYGESAVNLVLPGTGPAEAAGVIKLSNLAIAAAGGLQLTDGCPELTDYFTPDREVLVYRSLDELVAKAAAAVAAPAADLGQRSRAACRRWGWDSWWSMIRDQLEAEGRKLDLTSESPFPDGESRAMLANVPLVMGHVYEARGETAVAEVYFRETLALVPDDYGALSGIARLSGDAPAALPAWRAAAEAATFTIAFPMATPFDLQGLSPTSGTGFALEAASQWLNAAIDQEAWDEAAEALARIGWAQPDFVLSTVEDWLEAGRHGPALVALNGLIALHPKQARNYRLRSRLHQATGQAALAEADQQTALQLEDETTTLK